MRHCTLWIIEHSVFHEEYLIFKGQSPQLEVKRLKHYVSIDLRVSDVLIYILSYLCFLSTSDTIIVIWHGKLKCIQLWTTSFQLQLVTCRITTHTTKNVTLIIYRFQTTNDIKTPIVKWPCHGLENVLVRRIQFWSILSQTFWGLNSSLRDMIRPFVIIQDRIIWHKSTPDGDLRVKDRHISNVS